MMHARSRGHGFTLVEMMVVVGIIGVLMGLLLPALGALRSSSKNLESQSNERQITAGLIAYSVQNKDEIISPNTRRSFFAGGNVGQVTCKAWVEDSPANLYTSDAGTQYERPMALQEGYAAAFIGNGGSEGGVYRSPLDPTERIRSYSLNGAIGRNPDVGFMEVLGQLNIENPPARTVGHVKLADRTLYVIPEAMSYCGGAVQYNVHGYIVNFFQPVWIDAPAFFAEDGINLSFLDGHVAFHEWENSLIDHEVPTTPTTFDGPDFEYIRSIMMPDLEHLIGADG